MFTFVRKCSNQKKSNEEASIARVQRDIRVSCAQKRETRPVKKLQCH